MAEVERKILHDDGTGNLRHLPEEPAPVLEDVEANDTEFSEEDEYDGETDELPTE